MCRLSLGLILQGVHDAKLRGRLAAREAETRRLAEAAAATELLLTEEAG